ncbi:zinc-ribbon domain protein [Orientia chuto str. Dubai]|uniref:Zinc-ribbon domain protein n=1 Tax=Orientia chuto str. Dubai TaxID=1359168 RepID=A0A0F3MK35_9RICK|nr:zinc-ribbon domain-containing protein [Candidatus Orientia mediorientalis]KJV56123.1 zinc-ribbon domain protein [Orientia chuto str. Dubai]
MQISCPQCNTIFALPNNKNFSFESIKKIKCSQCQHIWSGKLQDLISVPIVPANFHTTDYSYQLGSNIPSLLSREQYPVSISRYLLILPVILAILIWPLLFLTIKYNSAAQEIVLGETKHISLHDVTSTYIPETNNRIIQYKLFNNSLATVSLPVIKICTYDHNKKLIHSHLFSNESLQLPAKTYAIVKTKFYSNETQLKVLV